MPVRNRHQIRRRTNQQHVLACKGNIQCRSFLYPYIGCTSQRFFLPVFWEIPATHARFTLIVFQIPAKIVCRVRLWRVSVHIPRHPLLLCVSALPSRSLRTEWRRSFIRTVPCSSLSPSLLICVIPAATSMASPSGSMRRAQNESRLLFMLDGGRIWQPLRLSMTNP